MMTQEILLDENGLHIVIHITEDADVRLLHFSALPFERRHVHEGQERFFRLVELQLTGENHNDHHDSKHTGTLPGSRLRFTQHRDLHTRFGRKLEIEQEDALTGVVVTSHLQFFDTLALVRSWTTVANTGTTPVGLEYLSSFALTGLTRPGLRSWAENTSLAVPHNTWFGEAQWRTYTLPELGLSKIHIFSMKRLAYTGMGTWSTSQFLPMGFLENTESGEGLFWQIEHNGSWHWEIGDQAEHLYLRLSGPTDQEHQWWKQLQSGEIFTSVPVAVGTTATGFTDAIQTLTSYRRLIRRPNWDNEALPVIFNDYMNCLNADPTTQKLLPLIEAAAEVGCEYFCIDAGWYADGAWWDTVGQWFPSKLRFPDGLEVVLNRIKEKGMVPGLWLELEVMGMNAPLAKEVPDSWFFCRRGRRVIHNGRYQLDFRNPAVRAYADEVIDRLVGTYGVGYIKMDYNINAGLGTDLDANSAGDGLLEHNRAYLAWLDTIFVRYPELIIENCSSGGMRMDYALNSRHSIQSSSDQNDYRKNAVIAAAVPTAVTPEQCAVWSYPVSTSDREAVIFNLVNALLLRIHQSGQLASLSPEHRALVKEGIAYYKSIRHDISHSFPFWPLGLPTFSDEWVSLGLTVNGSPTYLALWRLQSRTNSCLVPIPYLRGKEVRVTCVYPMTQDCHWLWHAQDGMLSVSLPQPFSARLFQFLYDE